MITGAVRKNFLNPNLDTHFSFLESQIVSSPDKGHFLCGKKLTGADILMSFPLSAARGRSSFSKETCPKLWEYVDRIQAMEGYKKAEQKIVDAEGSFSTSL